MNTKKSFFIVLSIATLQLNAADHRLVEKKEENPFKLAASGRWEPLKQHPRVVVLREQGNPNPIYTLLAEEFSKKQGDAGIIRGMRNDFSEELNDYDVKPEALCNIVTKGNMPLMELFLQNDVHPDSFENMMCSRSALSLAIDKENVEAIRLLFQYEANPNMTVMHGSPLMCAMCIECEKKREEVVRLLINEGAHIDLVVDEDTALTREASSGDIQGVKLLLSLGAHNRIKYKFSESRKKKEKDRQKRESERLLRITSVLEEALAEEKDEKYASINEKIQLVMAYLKKDTEGHDADSCKESITICAIDRVHEKLNRHEFALTDKEKEAFIAVKAYLRRPPIIEPVDRQLTDREILRTRFCNITLSISECIGIIGDLLDRDKFRLEPNEKAELLAVKRYLEQETAGQEMLVVNQEENEIACGD